MFNSVLGCDSIVMTTIQVLPLYELNDTLYFCQGSEIVLPDGTILENITTNTNYPISYFSQTGCDSVVIFNLQILPTYAISNTVQHCTGLTYTFPDNSSWIVIHDTTQTSYFTTLSGCDSILITTIQSSDIFQSEIYDTICYGLDYTFADGSTSTNIIKDMDHVSNLLSQTGCDSTIITHLTVLPIENTQFTYLPEEPTIETDRLTFFPIDSSLIDFNWQVFNDDELLYSWTDTVLDISLNQLPSSAFSVCLSSDNEYHCISQTCVELSPTGNLYIYVPNAFSPNRDTKNDSFAPVISGKPFMDYEFIIYNRWGEIVFYSDQYPESWDGTYQGEMSPLGVYTYTLYLKEVGNVTDYRYRGHVTIVR
jgi:gliding motility-associated-like protein